MQTLGQLARARRVELGLTLEQVAGLARCAKGYLSMIENDRRESPPSEGMLGRLEVALRLAPGTLVRVALWQVMPAPIRREVQEMQRSTHAAGRLAALLRERGVDAAHRSGELRRLVEQLGGAPSVETIALPAHVPVINKVAAGYPTEFTDLGYPARVADEYVSTPDVRDPEAFAARVVGDSMAPQYVEGDIVVFSPERDTPAGTDCFVRLERDNETTFKRVYFEEGEDGEEMIRLQPLNSAHRARVLRREDVAGMYAAVYVIRAV